MEVLMSEKALLLEGSQVSPICPSGKRDMYMKMRMVHWWNDSDKVKWNTRRNAYPIGSLPTTDLKWTGLGSNAGFRGERPAPNGL